MYECIDRQIGSTTLQSSQIGYLPVPYEPTHQFKILKAWTQCLRFHWKMKKNCILSDFFLNKSWSHEKIEAVAVATDFAAQTLVWLLWDNSRVFQNYQIGDIFSDGKNNTRKLVNTSLVSSTITWSLWKQAYDLSLLAKIVIPDLIRKDHLSAVSYLHLHQKPTLLTTFIFMTAYNWRYSASMCWFYWQISVTFQKSTQDRH